MGSIKPFLILDSDLYWRCYFAIDPADKEVYDSIVVAIDTRISERIGSNVHRHIYDTLN